MDNQGVSQYYTDGPPTVVPLPIKSHFEALTDQQKLYAHNISRYVITRDLLFSILRNHRTVC